MVRAVTRHGGQSGGATAIQADLTFPPVDITYGAKYQNRFQEENPPFDTLSKTSVEVVGSPNHYMQLSAGKLEGEITTGTIDILSQERFWKFGFGMNLQVVRSTPVTWDTIDSGRTVDGLDQGGPLEPSWDRWGAPLDHLGWHWDSLANQRREFDQFLNFDGQVPTTLVEIRTSEISPGHVALQTFKPYVPGMEIQSRWFDFRVTLKRRTTDINVKIPVFQVLATSIEDAI